MTGSEIKKVKPKVQISEYQKGKVVGQGAFGKVMLAKEIATGNEVAIKEVDQATIAKLGKTRHIFREKNLLKQTMDNVMERIIELMLRPDAKFPAFTLYCMSPPSSS